MIASHDAPQLRDIPAALGLLSRLPVRVNTDHATARGAKAAWAYPVAGLAIAMIAAAVAQLCTWLGLAPHLSAGLTLATLVITTGAMHEDGLADSADGLWGGWSVARRLEIMKDSHIGAYGVIALVLSLGLRWQALALLIGADMLLPALFAAAALSRAIMVPVMAILPNSRATGLSQMVGRASHLTALIAIGIAAAVAFISLAGLAVWAILASSLAALASAAIAHRKIKGQTGDILGATQQLSEIATLLCLSALVV